ncbi:hypothetical protein [Shewanella oncorhynchi]|uniref:hypothetical protein n=1 Tax=Shewanella oncorhynchi TaxID=2726434 RepID=UPI003D78D452
MLIPAYTLGGFYFLGKAMTTIAYHHKDKQIAFDSRSSRDNVIMSDDIFKSKTVNDIVFIICGSACDETLFIDMFFGAESKIIPNCDAYAVDKGITYRCGIDDGVLWKHALEHNDSLGSGWMSAISAMDFGLSAEESVKYAMKRDCFTGGKVNVYDITSKSFLKI